MVHGLGAWWFGASSLQGLRDSRASRVGGLGAGGAGGFGCSVDARPWVQWFSVTVWVEGLGSRGLLAGLVQGVGLRWLSEFQVGVWGLGALRTSRL
jgi:hypothetical protein